ncbi:hypothetical protein WMF28_42280 [Sorangium sp. So ce590]|uniref:hypothetical protein n=1 Tax=Sorangium sp. So ce590 TaxID=3133317 RepID=UPI003F63843C
MSDRALGELLEPHNDMLKDMAQSLAAGDRAKLIGTSAALVAALATGNPQVALLAPFAEKAVACAFGNAADDMFRRELAAMEREEDRRAFIAQIGDAVEALIGQALIQIVRSQHRVKEEVLEALGGVREDLAAFRERFGAELGGAAARVDLQVVTAGAIGVRVRATTGKRVFIARQEVSGAGSVGIDLE